MKLLRESTGKFLEREFVRIWNAGMHRARWTATPRGRGAGGLGECEGLEFIIDGVERPIQRPKNPERQRQFYSGKKKRHSIKNNLISDRRTRKIKGLNKPRRVRAAHRYGYGPAHRTNLIGFRLARD